MYIGQVAGTVVATIKHPMFVGHKLLLVERLDLAGQPDAQVRHRRGQRAGRRGRPRARAGRGHRRAAGAERGAMGPGALRDRGHHRRSRPLGCKKPGCCARFAGVSSLAYCLASEDSWVTGVMRERRRHDRAGAARGVRAHRPADAHAQLRDGHRRQPLGPARRGPLPGHPQRAEQGLHDAGPDGGDRLGRASRSANPATARRGRSSLPPRSCCTSKRTGSGRTSRPSSTRTRSTPSRCPSPASRWRAACCPKSSSPSA